MTFMPSSAAGWAHALGCILFLAIATTFGGIAGSVTGGYRWPYHVQSVTLLTPVVEPGNSARVRKVIDYREECEMFLDARLQSLGPDGRRQSYPETNLDRAPFYLDGKPQTVDYEIPADFPCGPAMIVESPSAACTWIQRTFRRQRAEDRFIKLTVCKPPPL